LGDYVLDARGGGDDLSAMASRWWAFLLMGIAAVVVGVILVLDLVVAVETLALLIALGLAFTGVGELIGMGRYRSAWSIAAGILLIGAAVVALVWPGITLWALAVVTAFGLLLSGALRVGAAMADKPRGWGWILAGGVLSLVVGVMALSWPGATVLVLAILLGIRMIIFGAVEIAFAMTLREAR
jgi:uncharacterized membrane protein HdeD (DUF308 family)